MSTVVKMTKTMGRGVFTTKSFNKGNVIFADPCVILKGDCHNKLQDSILRFYCFEGSRERRYNECALALGMGSLINHSEDYNVSYQYNEKRNVIVFKATRTISKGEQLFINYGYDPVDKMKRWELKKAEDERKEVDYALDRKMQPSSQDDQQYQFGDIQDRLKPLSEAINEYSKPPQKKLWHKIKDWFNSPVSKSKEQDRACF